MLGKVNTKEELLKIMMPQGFEVEVLQKGTRTLDYIGIVDKFYYSPMLEVPPEEITDEKAIEVYNEHFSLSRSDVGPSMPVPLEHEMEVSEALKLSAVHIDDYSLDLISSPEFEAEYNRMLHAIDKISEIKEIVDNKVKELMKEQYLVNGENKIEGNEFSMTYIPESFRERFDAKKFKEEHPTLHKKYTAISKVKESLRINRRRGK